VTAAYDFKTRRTWSEDGDVFSATDPKRFTSLVGTLRDWTDEDKRANHELGTFSKGCVLQVWDSETGAAVLRLEAETGAGGTNGIATFATAASPVNVAVAHDSTVVVFLLDAWLPAVPELPRPVPGELAANEAAGIGLSLAAAAAKEACAIA
jgi:hypothetical protein